MNWKNINKEQPEVGRKVIIHGYTGDHHEFAEIIRASVSDTGVYWDGMFENPITDWIPLPDANSDGWRNPISDVPSPFVSVLCLVENRDGSTAVEIHKTKRYPNGSVGWGYGWENGGIYEYPILRAWMPLPED